MTAAEAARLLSTLDRQPVSVAQVRSVLVLDTRGRAMTPRSQGHTRLFTAVDVALVRLTLRLRDQGVSPTVARVVVAGLRDVLAEHWTHGDPMALALVGLRGLVVYASAARPTGVVAWVPLRDVWRGVDDAMTRVRRAQPEVWQWKRQPAASVLGEARDGR